MNQLEELINKLADKKIKAIDAFALIKEKASIGGKNIKIKGNLKLIDGRNTIVSTSQSNILLNNLEAFLIEQIANVLKVTTQDIDINTNFLELGLESITLVQLAETFETIFSIKLYPTLFFEYKNIEDLTGYFLNNFRQELFKYFQVPDSMDKQNDEYELPKRWIVKDAAINDEAHQYNHDKKAAVEPIAVIGMSGRFPKAATLELFWNILEQREDCIQEIPKDRWEWQKVETPKWGGFISDIDKFDAGFFNIAPSEAELMDPQHRLFLEEVWKCIQDAGFSPKSFAGTKTGVFIGISTHDYENTLHEMGADIEAHTSTGNVHCVLPNRISYLLNIHGPSQAIDTACSGSLIAIKKAVESIRNGESELALAGGVNALLHPELNISFSKAGMLSGDGRCKTFDKRANGYVRGEGGGAILLKLLSKAIADGDYIYGVIRGVAENHGGRATSLTAPNPNAQAELLVEAYTQAEIGVDTVSYIEAHGTGTSLGDPIEINGLKKAFATLAKIQGKQLAEKSCGISSVKTNIGHLEAAAGIASVIKVLLAMKHKKLPGTVHFEEINPYIEFKDTPFYVIEKTKAWEKKENIPRRAGISAFGFGGANAHIVIEEYEDPNFQNRTENLNPQLIVLSAKNQERLKEYAMDLVQYIKINKDKLLLQDIAHTLQVGREGMEERLGIIAQSKDELIDKLDKYIRGEKSEGVFYGNGKKKGEKTTLFEHDEFLQETIHKWIAHGRIKKLVELWIDGMEVDWTMLPHDNAKKISLPTYPFAKDRYWALARTKGVNKIAQGITLHPLLDNNGSTLFEQKFKKYFRNNEFYLKDHVVLNKNILPGVAYLEMARAAGNFALEKEIRKIHSVIWLRPIEVDNEGKEVQIVLYPEGKEIGYEIVDTGARGEKIVYSQGKLGIIESEIKNGVKNLKEIESRCSKEIPKEEVYKLYQARSIKYGESFQVIESIKTNSQECICKLVMPKKMEGEFDKYILHPSIMDGALQSCIGVMGEDTDGTYVPFGLSELNIYRSTPMRCYAYVRLIEEKKLSKKYDIELLEEDGSLIVSMKGLGVRALGKAVAKEEVKNEVVYYGSRWVEKEKMGEIEEGDKETILLISALEKVTSKKVIFGKIGESEKILEEIKNEGKNLKYLVYHTKEESSEENAYELLQLLQVLMKSKVTELKALYVYEGTDAGGEAISGLMKTVEQEYPKYKCKVVGIEKDISEEKQMEVINGELKAEGKEVRYIEEKRYERELYEIYPKEMESTKVPLKKDGVYWITGGTGGLGIIIAKHLAEKYKAKLALTGRMEWNELIRDKLKQLEEMGASVIYIQGDVSNKKDVKRILGRIKKQFGGINGIIHSAGVIRDSLLINKNLKEAKLVITPKVTGTKNLDEVTKDEKLDFFIMFSSIAGVLGNIGQSDYAYANAFMDRYAEHREQLVKEGKRCGKTISIDWPLWEEGGMRVDDEKKQWLQKHFGLILLKTDQGIKGFEASLGMGLPSVLILPGDQTKLRSVFKGKVFELESKQVNAVANSQEVEKTLIDLCAEALKVDVKNIDINEELGNYGMDSIMMIKMLGKLEDIYGKTVEANAFSEYPTIKSFANFLIEKGIAVKISQINNKPQEEDLLSPILTPVATTNTNTRKRFISNNIIGSKSNDIAVVSLACRFPGAKSVEEFWENLKSGRSSIVEIPQERWDINEIYSSHKEAGKTYSKWAGLIDDIDLFDAKYFGISDDDALAMDPQQRILLEMTQELFDRGGYTKQDINGTKTGVFIGAAKNSYIDSNLHLLSKEQQKRMIVGMIPNMIAARVSDYYDLKGASYTIDTACSSSLIAVHQACEELRQNRANIAIAGGIELLIDPVPHIGFSQSEVLSDEPISYIFDERAKGIVLGEGVGLILLKRYEDAIQDGDVIYGVIKGSVVNNDGHTIGVTVPSMVAQEEVIDETLRQTGIDASSISYLEAHGTGTLLGDPIEIKAATNIYRKFSDEKQYCAVGSVKSNIGHLLRSAGIASIIKVLLALKHKEIPPTLFCEKPHPRFHFEESPFYPVTKHIPWNLRQGVRRAAISSFGFGGTNCHMIIEEPSSDVLYNVKKSSLPMTIFNRKFYWLGKTLDDDIYRELLSQLYDGHITYEEAVSIIRGGV